MKKIITLTLFAQAFFLCLLAQDPATPAVDKSPMDMSYYPGNYPVLKINDKITEPLTARVLYSRPQKAGRSIYGGLVKYNEIWRLGANEATEIEFFRQVKIGGKKIEKGRYTLYAIVNEKTWTFILNKDTDTWGAFRYDQKKDIVRTSVTPQVTELPVESLAMGFEKTAKGCNLVVSWDNLKAALPVYFD